MASYEEFLKETPESAMTPEALRRLADLKIQKEYEAEEDAWQQQEAQQSAESEKGVLPDSVTDNVKPVADSASQATDIQIPETDFVSVIAGKEKQSIATDGGPIADISESEKAFSDRAGKKIELGQSKKKKIIPPGETVEEADDLQAAGAKEAIELYKGLLKKYPLFERNDQVLYQLSRAYEETGQIDIADRKSVV